MNIKKLVSAVSALTIAASAFAGLAVTASAAAGDVTTNASADFTDSLGDFTIVSSNETYPIELSTSYAGWLAVGNGSGTVTIADDKLAGANDVVTVSFKVAYGKLSGRSFYYKISDSEGTDIVSWDFNAYSGAINTNVLGEGSDLPTTSEFYYGYTTPITNRAASYVFTFDFAKNTVTQQTTNMYNSAVTTHSNPLPEGVDNVKTLTIGSNYSNNERRCVVDDILIQTTEGDSSLVGYTLSYKVNGEGDAVYSTTGSAAVGETVTAVASFKNTSGDKYYVDEPQTFTIAESGNDFVQSCRAANVYAVNVNATGDISQSIIADTVVEGESYSYGVPQYIVKDGTAYEATPLGSTYYAGSVANANADTIVDVTYTQKYTDVVAYDELDGSTDKNADVRASNGSAYNNAAYTSAELPAGTYKAVVGFSNIGRGSTLTVGDTTLITSETDCTKNAWTTFATAEFTITEPTALVWNAGSSGTYDPIDTVLIIAVPKEPTTVTATNVGAFEDDTTLGTTGVATAFKANMYGVTGTLNFTVTTSEGETRTFEGATTLANDNVILGIIVNGLNDAGATGVLTVVE
ncbi:MAG: hypothetical protein ACI4EA_13160 [Candidatus Ornithomonoglobus sp.]